MPLPAGWHVNEIAVVLVAKVDYADTSHTLGKAEQKSGRGQPGPLGTWPGRSFRLALDFLALNLFVKKKYFYFV